MPISVLIDGRWEHFADDPDGSIAYDREPNPRFDRIKTLHKRHAKPSPVIGVTAETRMEILEIILAIESGEASYKDEAMKKEDLGILWGKVGYLNGQLGLSREEIGNRYADHSWTGEKKAVIKIAGGHPCADELDC